MSLEQDLGSGKCHMHFVVVKAVLVNGEGLPGFPGATFVCGFWELPGSWF